MAKKKEDTVQSFVADVVQAVNDNYMPMPRQLDKGGNDKNGLTPFDMDQTIDMMLSMAQCSQPVNMWGGNVQPKGLTPTPLGSEVPTSDDIGTPGRGYIEWGAGNRLPNIIANLTQILPYTATAAKFNVDVMAGMGFTPKYKYSAVSNGTLVSKEIDYKDAGVLLEQQLIDAREKLLRFLEEDSESRVTSNSAADLQRQALLKTYTQKVENATSAYKKWVKTNEQVSHFVKRNNLPLLAVRLFNDMVYYNIAFPELELSKMSTEQPDNARWKPKVTSISYRDAQTCRLEKMSDDGKIEYVYHSSRWYDRQAVQELTSDDIIAIPAVDPEHPIDSLEKKIRDFKISHAKGSASDRPTRFILPAFSPTPGRPYYPQPSWYSIYGGDIYPYLSTIVSDRYTRRKNKNIIGHIIYVHQDYIRQLVTQRQTELSRVNPKRSAGAPLTQAEQQELLDEMWTTINTFLTNSDNAGKPLLAFSFTGADGKEHDAYRIVDVPNTTDKDAKAQKTELEEISAIVFFAFQCHPELVGAVPGRTGAGGGTYQRELYLLKQCQVAPTQELVTKVLDTVSKFNEWDEHLVWRIRQQVLTTLDNSKTGLVESQNQ